MKTCVIHVGVHKTATSYVQSILKDNAAALRERNIAYTQARERIEGRMLREYVYEGDIEGGRKWLRERVGDADTVFLSDEELIGRFFKIERGFPYKNSGQYVNNLIEMLPPETEVVLMASVRDYADYIESCYLQFLKFSVSRPYTFEKYYKKFDLDAPGWVGLIRDLSAIPRISAFHVWTYESFKRDGGFLFSLIESFVGKLDRFEVNRVENPSFSIEAVNILLAAENLQKEHHKMLRKLLKSTLVTSNGYRKPTLMSPEQRSMWKKKYDDDLMKIKEMCGDLKGCHVMFG